MDIDIIPDLYKKFIENPFVTTDSRNTLDKSVFFALKGENFDGNVYAESALENGASVAVIDNPAYKKDDRYFLVENTLEALQDLASYHRKKMPARIIGITGTNGKTTTKELINIVLLSGFNVISTSGNLNNHIGVPLTLLRINLKTDFAVVEMGANHPGEIANLCAIAKPDFGIITNIGKAHLEGFGSFENIILTKKELYNAISENKGMIFINRDNKLLASISKGIKSFDFAFGTDGLCLGKVISCNPILQYNINLVK